ncbi:BBE domain-containing protein [Caulobacter sp. S45]|uniref:BBE domain-containing protein n=1 Tax=Caulobacter sp. S45 TaxID=1641861 RepID=UPI001575E869|nr:BBE domain-containing protein [Caulobacter sp. S45]
MLFQGLDEAAAREAWRPLVEFVAAHPADYRVEDSLQVAALPAQRLWDEAFLSAHLPAVLKADARPGARAGDWWWTGNTEEAGAFWHGYQSAWPPASLLQPGQRRVLAQAWFEASRHWSTTLHFNKGLGGAPAEARAASADTAMNPQVLDAFALAIIAMDGRCSYLGPPDLEDARADAASIRTAMTALRRAAPAAGSYVPECDHALADWREAIWGHPYARLERIKQRYDPDGLFTVPDVIP